MAEVVTIELQGKRLVMLALGSQGPRRRMQLKALLTDVANIATAQMRIYAPRGSGYTHEHINQGPMTYLPGGAGGGGTYQIVTGVRRGRSKHPLYVEFGTAGASDDAMLAANQIGNHAGPGRIYPTGNASRIAAVYRFIQQDQPGDRQGGHRPVLTFQKKGEPRKFRLWVRGQSAQPFVYWSFVHASIYAGGRLEAAARNHAFA